jgi:multisubunit Na+/H+ antiporter MnhC subunit
MRRPVEPMDWIRRADWSAVAIWSLCFGLVVYLGLKGGGYDAIVQDRVGIAIWWAVLALVLAGALPQLRPSRLAWAVLGLFAAFTAWTGLSLIWTESTERTAADLARLAGFLGVFLLALFGAGVGGARRIVSAVAAGTVVVGAVALLSRLHPSWFPEATQTAELLSNGEERLSYPLNYWNGLAALVAIGLPLLLAVATTARSVIWRALAAAAIPAMGLTAFFTFSRAGIAAAFVALAVFIVFTSNRLPKLLTLLVAGAGSSLLIFAATQRDALEEGLRNVTARQQGDELFWIVIAVCIVVGLAQAVLSLDSLRERRPGWTHVPRGSAGIAAAVAAGVLSFGAVALDAPSRASDAWSEFKEAEEGPGSGASRLGSAAGESRYEFWKVAAKQNADDPLIGTGSGTFEFWWTRNSDASGTVRDAHSLYMQTFGELGIFGALLLAALLLTILIGGSRNALRARAAERPLLAAALAGCVAFCFGATFDWLWQIPVLSILLLLLAVVLVSPGSVAVGDSEPGPFNLSGRLAIAATALAAIFAIAIPLASTSLLRESEAEARAGDLDAALSDARSAQNVLGGAMSPRLQRAVLLETLGDFDAATVAAREAIEREPTNWRTWLVLSRIEAQRGNAAVAVVAFRRARSLNPQSPLFER